MSKYSHIEHYSRVILYLTFLTATFLGVIHGSIDRKQLVVKQYRRKNKITSRIMSVIVVIIYWGVMPNMFYKFVNLPLSYIQIFATAQSVSVSIFAVCSFIVQARKEAHVIKILNRYFRLHQHVIAKTGKTEIFTRMFLMLLLLKVLATLFGVLNEIPELMQLQNVLNFGYWISVLIGIYMWLGSMFVLDTCFLGFLVLATIYGHMGRHIGDMLCSMHRIITKADKSGKRLSNYRRMRLLCDYADTLDEFNDIYARLYGLTKKFQNIFQWKILYYVYYNFMVILLLMHQCIWQYIESSYIDFISLFMVTVKIGNITLLAMCAHYTVLQSQLPSLLCLDVVCTDIDVRWDRSVQAFLNRRKFENLEIKILGIFELNNEFILLLLSAIISYLFILLQFGITGGFEQSQLFNYSLNKTS